MNNSLQSTYELDMNYKIILLFSIPEAIYLMNIEHLLEKSKVNKYLLAGSFLSNIFDKADELSYHLYKLYE